MNERVPQRGDQVILRFLGRTWEVGGMKKYLGTVQTVKSVNRKYNTFTIKRGEDWVWRFESIESFVDDEPVEIPGDDEILEFLGFEKEIKA